MLGKVYTEVRNNILNQVHIYKYSEKGLSKSTIFRKGGGGYTHLFIYSLCSLSEDTLHQKS